MTPKTEPYGSIDGLPEPAICHVAQYFFALSEPIRLRLLNHLRDGEQKVGELAVVCACSQANVSRHLSILAKSGLVTRKCRGTFVYYQIADPTTYQLCEWVCNKVAQQLQTQIDSFDNVSITT
jgi:DNA-binding transcriptional ArsR family regulator